MTKLDPPQPPKFCTRLPPAGLALQLTTREIALTTAFGAFRAQLRQLTGNADHRRRLAGTFAVEILNKRLLSCPTAFADSWKRTKDGLAEAAASSVADVQAAERSLRQETGDDRETEARELTAAGVVGSWLKDYESSLTHEIVGIDRALADLGFSLSGTIRAGKCIRIRSCGRWSVCNNSSTCAQMAVI